MWKRMLGVASVLMISAGGDLVHTVDLPIAERNLRYVSSGDPQKPPILFVHGSPGSWRAWSAYLEDDELTAHAHLIAVDRPGFGGSGRGDVEPSLAVQAGIILAALKDNRSEQPAIVVGHSLGGPVAARIAMDHAERVAALVLLAPSISAAEEKITWYMRLARWRPVSWMVPRDLRAANDEIYPLKGELEAMEAGWAQLQVPTILIHGTRDRLVPIANADFAAANMTAPLEIVRIPGAGHGIPWRHRDQVRRALFRLLMSTETP